MPDITDPIDRSAAERGVHLPDPPRLPMKRGIHTAPIDPSVADPDPSQEPVTILQLALYRLGLPPDTAQVNAAQLSEAGLAIMGGCLICGATLAAYNGCPTREGYWACLHGCAEQCHPWYDVGEANAEIFGDDLPKEQQP